MELPKQPQNYGIPPASEIFLSYAVLIPFLLMLLPMPGWLLDFMVAFNLISALLVLGISLYVNRPSEFSSLPSIVFLGTLFRAGLSISFFRACFIDLIEFYPRKASVLHVGQILNYLPITFSNGDVLVGFLLVGCLSLLILGIVLGVQAFTANNSKLLQQALAQPDLLLADQRESQCQVKLHGSSQLLVRESWIGLLMTALAIGGLEWIRRHMAEWGIDIQSEELLFKQVMLTYLTLGVGELFIRQIPIFFTVISIGLISAQPLKQDANLAKVILQEVQAKPYGILLVSLVTILIAASNLFGLGFPWWVFLPIGLCLGGMAFSVFLVRDIQAQLKQVDWVQSQMAEPEHLHATFPKPCLILEVPNFWMAEFKPLLPAHSTNAIISTSESQRQLLMMKQHLFETLGYIIPSIEILPSQSSGQPQLCLLIQGVSAVVIELSEQTDSNSSESLSLEPYIPEIQEALILNAHKVLSRKDIQTLLEMVLKDNPTLLQELLSRLDFGILRQVLAELIKARISIRNLVFLVECLCGYAAETQDPVTLAQKLKKALAGTGDDF